MLGRDYPDENCSIARALEVLGERWSLLILRDALFRGMSRYSQFQQSLDIASNVLADRLKRLVDEGLFERVDGGTYRTTAKAHAVAPVLLALTAWGDTWAAPHGAPIIYRNTVGAELHIEVRDDLGQTQPPGAPISAHPGPGSDAGR